MNAAVAVSRAPQAVVSSLVEDDTEPRLPAATTPVLAAVQKEAWQSLDLMRKTMSITHPSEN